MTNAANYIDIRKRKSYSQQALFEEEPEEPPVAHQPEPVELKPEPPIIEKKEEDAVIEEPKPIEELPITEKIEPCEKCKQPITYRSDDFHPGILCPHCKNGQKNPNLKQRGIF